MKLYFKPVVALVFFVLTNFSTLFAEDFKEAYVVEIGRIDIGKLSWDINISDDDYKEVELIGWLYQFYIADKKDDVFASFKKKQKARAEDIPAATQIFTPKWIVKYLVENDW